MALVGRSVLLAGVWWILTDGRPGSWTLGGPLVLLAALLSLRLSGGGGFSPSGLIGFLPFFLWHSLKGGVDVAARAFRPSLPIAPALVDYRLRLPPGPGPVFMANVASLLPGTLAAGLDGERLQVHVLDHRGDYRRELAALERRVADLFGTPLGPAG